MYIIKCGNWNIIYIICLQNNSRYYIKSEQCVNYFHHSIQYSYIDSTVHSIKQYAALCVTFPSVLLPFSFGNSTVMHNDVLRSFEKNLNQLTVPFLPNKLMTKFHAEFIGPSGTLEYYFHLWIKYNQSFCSKMVKLQVYAMGQNTCKIFSHD